MHKRNTGPMNASPRCGARTRAGHPCNSPTVRSKTRCRMHGGAKGSGAPLGNKNARKHGAFSAETLAYHKDIRAQIQAIRRDVLEAAGRATKSRPKISPVRG